MNFSRRDFGKIALAGLPLSAAFAAKIDSKVNGVQIGVQSYSFRDRGLDDAIKAMADCGLGECELFAQHTEPGFTGMRPAAPGGLPRDPVARAAARNTRNTAREEIRKWRLSVPMDHFKEIRKKFNDAGINVFGFNYSFNDTFTDDEIDRGFDMANALGAKVITASTTISVAKRVVPFAEKHKMIVAMHGHSNLKDPEQFAKPESFAAAMAMSKYYWVNLDIGHFVAANYDPIQYIKEHHDRISNIHLKDRKKNEGANIPWGEGDTPIKEVLQLIKQNHYNIPAFIEYEYKGDDPVEEVKKCFEYCKTALA